MRRLSLSSRVVLAMTVFGAVLSSVFALQAYWVTEDFEDTLLSELLNAHAQSVQAQLGEHPESHPASPERVRILLSDMDLNDPLLPVLEALAPGVHELEPPGAAEIHVGVFESDNRRIYLITELDQIETRERHLLALMALILVGGTVLSAWIGHLFAGSVIRPVRVLAHEVDRLGPLDRCAPLASSFGTDEVGRLAAALDAYRARLAAYSERERAFTADASHEMRTPLAVIGGAIDVLLDDPQVTGPLRTRTERLARGFAELSDLLDALLLLSRQPQAGVEDRAFVKTVAENVIAEHRDAFDAVGISVDLRIEPGAAETVVADPTALRAVLRYLLRILTERAGGGVVQVAIGDGVATFAYLPRDVDGPSQERGWRDPPPKGASDRDRGIGLILRLCERCGWKLQQHSGIGPNAYRLHVSRD
jgi:signal transduction histidine kinase